MAVNIVNEAGGWGGGSGGAGSVQLTAGVHRVRVPGALAAQEIIWIQTDFLPLSF